jgi:hypothetical protein
MDDYELQGNTWVGAVRFGLYAITYIFGLLCFFIMYVVQPALAH